MLNVGFDRHVFGGLCAGKESQETAPVTASTAFGH